MSQAAPLPFSDLPHELQREIFVAAVRDDPRSALHLVLVARKVYEWIQPLLYQLVALGRFDSSKFAQTVETKPAEFFAVNVKHLCLSISVSAEKASRILQACTGVVELALWVDFGGTLVPTAPTAAAGAAQAEDPTLPAPLFGKSWVDGHRAAQALAALPLRRLSIEQRHFYGFVSALRSAELAPPPWYASLTHLEVVFWTLTREPSVPGLEVLTSLTHLALGLRHPEVKTAWLQAIVDSCATLRVVIPMANEDDEVEEPFQLGECWIVPLQYPHSVIGNWEASYWGLPDNYVRAEEEIRLKIGKDEAGSSSG